MQALNRKTDMKTVPVCLAAWLAFVLSASAQIVLTEIHYHPVEEPVFNADGTPFLNLAHDVHEFVEIQNSSSSTVDLSGWSLGGGISYTFPTNTTMEPGAFRVIAKNPERLATVYSLNVAEVLGPYSGYLGNRSDTVRVRDVASKTIDSVTYESVFPWAGAADALGASDRFTGLSSTNYQYKGRSLQRVSVTWPANDPANWLASPLTGPTPGAAQSVTRAIPKPVVVAKSAVQTSDGARIIRANQAVTVQCTYSATNNLSSVTLEYFLDNINSTSETHASIAMTDLGGGKYTASIPGQLNRAIVRYRFNADRGDGLEVVSPRSDDPQIAPIGASGAREAWDGYFVTPSRTSSKPAIYDVFVSTTSLTLMGNNISQNPNRVTAASATGLPRDIPYVAASAPQWNSTVAGVFATDGQLWDIQIRYHGSKYHRTTSNHSYKLHFPSHQPFNGQSSWFETLHGTEFIEAQKLNRLLGLPASTMRQVDWYLNSGANEVHGEQGEYAGEMLDDWHKLQQQLNPGSPREETGELYKDVGNRQNELEGPYADGNEAPLPANAAWSQLKRYEWTFSLQNNGWKGPKPVRDLIEGMWTARGDTPATHSFANSPTLLANARGWFTNNWDIDTTITSMALLEWMSIWDDAKQNHFFWRRANGKWSRLGWDYDGVMSTSGSGGGPGGGGAMGGTTNQTIYGGEYGATSVFDGVNWWKDTFYKCFRAEYLQRLWQLNNSFFDPVNLTAQGFTVAPVFARNRQAYINSLLTGTYGIYYKPGRPVNNYPAMSGIVLLATNFVTSAYSHIQGTPHLATRWEIRTATGNYEDPVLSVTSTNDYLTNYPIPFDQLTYGQQYYWRATHIDTNGHPSVVSAETAFSWGAVSTSAGALVMNEILADNHSTFKNGDRHPDYIELFNNGSTNIILDGYALTDNPMHATKYTFPSGTEIPAGGYLMVWCDSEYMAPGLHAGFGLSKEGQTVLLMQNETTIVDSVTFGPQAPDVSIGRIANGTGGWQANTPTPGTDNSAMTLGPVANLRINEWMADPAYGDDWFELYNTDTNVVALAGLYLSDTVSTPKITQIPALSFIAGNGWTVFRADGSKAGGNHCDFALGKNGESVVLTAANGTAAIDTVTFNTQTTDVSQGRFPDGSNTIVSFTNTVSPGYCNWAMTDVVINELLANPGTPLEDAIELYNSNSAARNIGGWWLSNDLYDRKKYQIPSGTTIDGHGYKVFYASEFATGLVPFEFDATGGNAILSAEDSSGNLTGIGAVVSYGAAPTNSSFGRVTATGLNNTLGGAEFWAQTVHTFGQDNPADVATFHTSAGAMNGLPQIGPVTISEIMCHPPNLTNIINGITSVTDDSLDEFIELYNISSHAVDLSGWQLKGDASFAFANGTTLAAGGYLLLVSFDPLVTADIDAFRTFHGLSNGAALYGPYSDKLPNSTAHLELTYPMLIDGYTNDVTVDKVEYRDDSSWPGKADGKGSSLSRTSSNVIGNNAANWTSKTPTPGSANPGAINNAVISTASVLPGGVVNSTYMDSFVATGGTPPYSWAITSGLVPGLSLATDGLLSGSPTEAGTNIFTVSLTDGSNFATNKQFTLVIATKAPAIATGASLEDGTMGLTYAQTLSATDGTAPYTWSFTGGSLPEGLSVNSGGLISGVPMTHGLFNFTAQVTDYYGLTAGSAFSISIESATLAITTITPMINGQVDVDYSQALTGVGGIPAYTWNLAGGSLPTGLSLDSLGDITGTPSVAGTFNFTVQLTDSLATTITKSLSITIVSPTVLIVTPILPNATLGTTYSQALAASGGTLPYTWVITWEALPNGLSLSGAGLVGGVPTTAGTFSFIVKVTDSANGSASQLFTIDITHNTPEISVESDASGSLQLLVIGDSGANYQIDSSTNLVDWTQAFTTNAAVTPFRWSDTTTNTATFYRVLVEP